MDCCPDYDEFYFTKSDEASDFANNYAAESGYKARIIDIEEYDLDDLTEILISDDFNAPNLLKGKYSERCIPVDYNGYYERTNQSDPLKSYAYVVLEDSDISSDSCATVNCSRLNLSFDEANEFAINQSDNNTQYVVYLDFMKPLKIDGWKWTLKTAILEAAYKNNEEIEIEGSNVITVTVVE